MPAAEGGFTIVETQAVHLHTWAMARDAFFLKNGLDITDEVGLRLRACHSERNSKKQKSHTTLFYIHGLVVGVASQLWTFRIV